MVASIEAYDKIYTNYIGMGATGKGVQRDGLKQKECLGTVSGCLVCPLLCSHAQKHPLLSFNKSKKKKKKISEEGSQPRLRVVRLFHQIVGQDKTEFATTVQKMLQ